MDRTCVLYRERRTKRYKFLLQHFRGLAEVGVHTSVSVTPLVQDLVNPVAVVGVYDEPLFRQTIFQYKPHRTRMPLFDWQIGESVISECHVLTSKQLFQSLDVETHVLYVVLRVYYDSHLLGACGFLIF